MHSRLRRGLPLVLFSALLAMTASAQTPEATMSSGERSLTRWFNTEAFTQPAPLTFGNSSPGLLRGDGVINFDVSLAKNVRLSRGRLLQLRFELFNSFNHPNFNLPGHTFGAPNFGVVSASGPARMIQLGARVVF